MYKYYIVLTYLIICLLIAIIMYIKFKNCNIIEFYQDNSFRAGGCKTCSDGEIVNAQKTGCERCPHGQKPNSKGTGCEPCPVGTAGKDGTCEPCKKDETYQNETGQIMCKECSKCEAHNYVSTECSLSSNTVCSRCNRKIIKNYDEVKLEINRYGHSQDPCTNNCKVEFNDALLENKDDVDIAGQNEDDSVSFIHYLKEGIQSHVPNNPVKLGSLTKEGRSYYFWQMAQGDTKWKFNIMTDPRKYNPANNYSKTCMVCGENKRPNYNGSECLDYYAQPWRIKDNNVW